MMADMSSRSEISCAWTRALRSMTAAARSTVAGSGREVPSTCGPAEDGVERRAQLVREGGEELVLEPVGGFGLLARLALAQQQLGLRVLGALALGDLAAQLGVGALELGGALAHQVLEPAVGPPHLRLQRHLLDGVLHGAGAASRR